MANATTERLLKSGLPRTAGTRLPLWVSLFILLAWNAAAQQQRDDRNPEGKWEVLENCLLTTNEPVDGDSFHVLHKGREYIFRLYFVDTPETDPTLSERAQDQAAYFGVSTNAVPRAGELAAQFTRETLAARPFTVVTRWQNAMGRSSLARFYCVVLVDGKNLAEELVARGLARIYGPRANWPDGPRSTTFVNQLKNRELEAREKRLGAWDDRSFARNNAAPGTQSTNAVANPAAAGKTAVDPNTATFEELQKLPGIGKTLAQRIIAHRPYKKVEDLDKVPGIGPTIIERLRPFIRVEPTAP